MFYLTFFIVFLPIFDKGLAKGFYFLIDFTKLFDYLFGLFKEVGFLADEIDYDSN